MTPADNTICLIDDDAVSLRALGRVLKTAGFHTESFTKVQDFIHYAEKHRVPLAIMDVWMPELTGLDIQSWLQLTTPDTQVIIMTGRDDLTVRATAAVYGAAAFFIKPFNDAALLAAVRAVLDSPKKKD